MNQPMYWLTSTALLLVALGDVHAGGPSGSSGKSGERQHHLLEPLVGRVANVEQQAVL